MSLAMFFLGFLNGDISRASLKKWYAASLGKRASMGRSYSLTQHAHFARRSIFSLPPPGYYDGIHRLPTKPAA